MQWAPSKTARLVAATAVLAGCGGDDRPDEPAPTGTLEITASVLADGSERFSVPHRVRGGLTQITFANATEQSRKAQIVRVDTTPSGTPELVAQGGVGSTNPSDVKSVVQWLAPGRYVVQGSDRDPARGAAFEVAGTGGNRRLPPANATITLDEYRIEASGLRFGRNLIRVRNVGSKPHEVFIAKLRGDETLADVRRSYSGRADRSPIRRALSGQETAILGEQEQVVEAALGAGRYALLCYASDVPGGLPHTTRGMVAVATIPAARSPR